MNNIFKLTILSMFAFVLVGCALTNENVDLNYTPSLSHISKVKSSKTLAVSKFHDQRGVNPNLIMHKINLNQQEASGMLLAKEPVINIFQRAVKESLIKTGYQIGKNGQYVLNGNLLNLNFKEIEGFFYGDLRCNIQFEFILSDAVTGKEIWEKTYNGPGYYRGETDQGDAVPVAFSRALNNLIHNFLNDSEFKRIIH